MKIWYWLWAPIVILIAVGAYLLGKRRGDMSSAVSTELAALEAKLQAKRDAAEHGTQTAAEMVERTYASQLRALDEERKAEAIALRSDPGALAAFLVKSTISM